MTARHNIAAISGQTYTLPLRLLGADGQPAALAAYDIYGAVSVDGTASPMAVQQVDASACLLSIHPLEAGGYAYDIYARHRSTAAEVRLLGGNITAARRVASCPPATGAGEEITLTLSADTTRLAVTVSPIVTSTPGALEALAAASSTLAAAADQAASLVPSARDAIADEGRKASASIASQADEGVFEVGEAATEGVGNIIDTAAREQTKASAAIAAVRDAAKADIHAAAVRDAAAALDLIDAATAKGTDTLTAHTTQQADRLTSAATSGQQQIAVAITSGTGTISTAATSGVQQIQAATTTGTGTIATAVASGKSTLDAYVAATSADLARKSQPNIWAGVNTLNGPVVLNDSATLTKATYAPTAVVNCDTVLALTYVAQTIQCGYYSAFDATPDTLNALAFTGVTATPSATAYAVRFMPGQGHGDLNNRYVTIRAEYGDNMCVHFGGGRTNPAGVVRMQAPYILHTDLPPGSDSPYYDHEAQYFAVIGKGYCANAQPVLILYHRASDEILYAEALMPAAKSCTISTHYLGGVAGKYYDQIYDIYSGRSGYVDASPRTRITLVGRGKYQMTGGGAVVSSVPNNAGRACVRTWPMVAPSEAQVAVIRAHTLAAAYSSVRTKPVTCDLPDACAVAAEGGVISGTATSVNAWPADYLAAYVVRLADWVSIRTVSDATQSSPAVTRIIGSGTITITVSPNTTGAPRSTCVLVGAPSCPARIITITQPSS